MYLYISTRAQCIIGGYICTYVTFIEVEVLIINVNSLELSLSMMHSNHPLSIRGVLKQYVYINKLKKDNGVGLLDAASRKYVTC